jgi:predicted Rossmann fold nucleotide-binding protein DprA/Smf involved in DNA uptake
VCDDTTGTFDPPLVRNRIIVDGCDVLLAAPSGAERDNPRSGTWMTVRYARKRRKRIVIVWPDGTTTEENAT